MEWCVQNEEFGEKKKEMSEVEEQKLKKIASNKVKVVLDHPPVQHLPYPHASSKKDKEKRFSHFLDIFKKLQINIPFSKALEQMSTYAKFIKELLTKKRRIMNDETIELEAGCSTIIHSRKIMRSRWFHNSCDYWEIIGG